MALSQDLISQFAKLTTLQKDTNKTETVKGTYRKIGGIEYVQIDGSEIWTPVNSTVSADAGDKVKVEIKNHIATITGNISNPSASSKEVDTLADTVDEHGNTIKQMNNTITQQGSTITQIDSTVNQVQSTVNEYKAIVDIQETAIQAHDSAIRANTANIAINSSDIRSQGDNISSLNTTVQAQNTSIRTIGDTVNSQGNVIIAINNEVQLHGSRISSAEDNINSQGNDITLLNNNVTAQGNTINALNNHVEANSSNIRLNNSSIQILNSGFQIVDGRLTGLSSAVIDELETDHLDARYATFEGLDAQYAHIDFANINYAAVTKIFTDSGIIGDLIVDDQHITGRLVGVTIVGDLIEGNTIKADKLVVKGEDGLYYKLNTDGQSIESEQTSENSLNGQVIAANSITASKISVEDLVAFGATIGGFHISDNSIFSGSKASIDNTTPGVYMDKDGQMAIGDEDNHIKFYYDEDSNKHRLEISADQIFIGDQSIAQMIRNLNNDQQQFVLSVKEKGGNNLILNSVMFGIDKETGNPLNWELDGAGTVTPHPDEYSTTKGCAAGNVFTLSNKTVKQRVFVTPWSEDSENNISYSFYCKVFKDSVGSGYIKLYNEEDEFLLNITDATDYETFKIEDIHPSMNYLDVEFHSDADAQITFTDVMLSVGNIITQWTQANGEIMNAYVAITNDGMTVTSKSNGHDYTSLTPEGFVGYAYDYDPDTEQYINKHEVFKLDGNTTKVNDLEVKTKISMNPIKIISSETGSKVGWAFVKTE